MLVGINLAVNGPAVFVPLTLTSELPLPGREWSAEASQGWHAAWAAFFSLPISSPDPSLQVALQSPATCSLQPTSVSFLKAKYNFPDACSTVALCSFARHLGTLDDDHFLFSSG